MVTPNTSTLKAANERLHHLLQLTTSVLTLIKLIGVTSNYSKVFEKLTKLQRVKNPTTFKKKNIMFQNVFIESLLLHIYVFIKFILLFKK